jgi:hypothetical protein
VDVYFLTGIKTKLIHYEIQADFGFEINPNSSESCESNTFKVVLEIMASNLRIEIKKFNGQNFELWKIKVEDLL